MYVFIYTQVFVSINPVFLSEDNLTISHFDFHTVLSSKEVVGFSRTPVNKGHRATIRPPKAKHRTMSYPLYRRNRFFLKLAVSTWSKFILCLTLNKFKLNPSCCLLVG